MDAVQLKRIIRGAAPLLAAWAMLLPGAWGEDAGGTLTINGERIEMPFAYARLEPDGFVPDSQELALVLANRELTPDEYYSFGEGDTHIIHLSVGPDQWLRSFTLVDEKLASGSISGFGFATLEFSTFDPPEFIGRLYTEDTFEGSQDRVDVDIRFRAVLGEEWNLAEALEKQEAYRSESASASAPSDDADREIVLFDAVESNDLDRVRDLVDAGASVDFLYGGAPLIGYAAKKGYADMVDLLLKNGATIDEYSGRSPLAMAIQSGSVPTVELLLASGLDLSGQDMTVETLGKLAVKTADPAMVKTLVGHIDFNAADLLGDTPALVAAREGGEAMQAIIGILGEAGADLSSQSGYYTPLYHAVDNNRPDMVRALLEAGAEPDQITREGQYPLMAALDKPRITELLLEAGADPNFKTDWGETPLMGAVGMEAAEVVELLLQHGADPAIENNQGYSALHMARSWGRDDIAALFEKPVPDAQMEAGRDTPADDTGQGQIPGAGSGAHAGLPKIQPIGDNPLPGAVISYNSTATVRDAMTFYDEYFTAEGWQIVANVSDYKSYATVQYESDAGGASLSISANSAVNPPETMISVTMHGTTAPAGFPRYPETEVLYEDVGTAIYLSDDPVSEVADGTRKIFAEAGWQGSDVASEPKFVHLRFIQASTTIDAVISEAPAQDNRTSIQYSVSSQ